MSSSEATPLAPGGAQSGLSSAAVKEVASNILTKENAGKAASYAKDQAARLQKMASDGNMSIRLMGLIGGIAMMASSVLGFVGNILSLKFFNAVIEVYTFLLGIVIIIIEGNRCPIPATFQENLFKYAMFLKFVWGRGCLYFVAGSLEMSQLNVVDFSVGAFMCFVGVIYIIVGRKTAKKLSELHKSMFSEHTLKAKFDEADTNNTGSLDENQFKTLAESLGMELSKVETSTAFIEIDKNNDGQISFDDFALWWKEWDYDSIETDKMELSV